MGPGMTVRAAEGLPGPRKCWPDSVYETDGVFPNRSISARKD